MESYLFVKSGKNVLVSLDDIIFVHLHGDQSGVGLDLLLALLVLLEKE